MAIFVISDSLVSNRGYYVVSVVSIQLKKKDEYHYDEVKLSQKRMRVKKQKKKWKSSGTCFSFLQWFYSIEHTYSYLPCGIIYRHGEIKKKRLELLITLRCDLTNNS